MPVMPSCAHDAGEAATPVTGHGLNVHVLQHVPFEDIGSMAPWLAARGAAVGYTRFYEAPAHLPPIGNLDLVIAMGGPMSVNDEPQHPWLKEEKRFIREAVRRGTPFVGICLGAQLLASAFGARVYPNREREIGWFPVASAPSGDDVFRFPASESVFHWHGETFDLPDGATRLAVSAACANQAFQIGPRALGLQFHLETTPASAADLIGMCRQELTPGAFVQSEATLRAAPPDAYARINRLMGEVLAYVTRT